MPTTTLTKSKNLRRYSVLRTRVRETLIEGKARIEREKVRTYWKTGKYINDHVRLNNGRAEYARGVLLRLSKDLGIDESVLRRTAEFHAAFPIRATWHELTWSHYRNLLPVKDPELRQQFAVRAVEEEWDVRTLRQRIRAHRRLAGKLPRGKSALLEPKTGTPGVYRVVASGNTLAVDLGFSSYVELSRSNARGLKAGGLVRFESGKRKPTAGKFKKSDLYTYSAELIRVVDGDTAWMKIWIAPPLWVKEKLRFRGIDTPELGTREGEEAKRFVGSIFQKAAHVTIKTTKPDKWDRYLSDIFIETKSGELIYLNNRLLARGYAYRSDRVRLADWDG